MPKFTVEITIEAESEEAVEKLLDSIDPITDYGSITEEDAASEVDDDDDDE